MTLVVVEREFPEPAVFDEIQAIEDAGAWCLDLHQVHFVRTYFSSDRQRMICLYEAPDAESVRLSQRRIGLPFERVWAATDHEPPVGTPTDARDPRRD